MLKVLSTPDFHVIIIYSQLCVLLPSVSWCFAGTCYKFKMLHATYAICFCVVVAQQKCCMLPCYNLVEMMKTKCCVQEFSFVRFFYSILHGLLFRFVDHKIRFDLNERPASQPAGEMKQVPANMHTCWKDDIVYFYWMGNWNWKRKLNTFRLGLHVEISFSVLFYFIKLIKTKM